MLQFFELLDRAGEARVIGIAEIDLIPARDVAADPPSEEQFDADPQPLGEAGHADHDGGNHVIAAAPLGAELLQTSGGLVIAGEYLAPEQPVHAHFAHDAPGIDPSQPRRRCSTAPAAVSPIARSTVT